MKSNKLILALWLGLGASAWAQTSPQKSVNPLVAAKPRVVARAGLANAPSPRNARVQSGKVSGKPLSSPAKSAAAKPATKSATKPPARFIAHQRGRERAVQPQSARTAVAAASKPKARKAQRDPFVSPVVERVRTTAACTGTGRQCLLVGELNLRGVVRSPSGFIAVVVNGEHTYFLRENDPLANGVVERITKDAIILREHSSDVLGRPLTREVIKKLGVVPAV